MALFASLIKKELLAVSRDVHGMAALFIMPMVFIVVMSMALKDVYSPSVGSLNYAVLDEDQGATARALVEYWGKEQGGASELPTAWRDEVRAGRLKYVLLIEPGFSRAVEGAGGKEAVHVRLFVEPGLDSGLFEANRMRLTAAVNQLHAERLLAKLPAGARAVASGNTVSVTAERLTAGVRPTSVQQNVPAWLVFGMFFVVASIAGLFVEERDCGALARLRGMGVKPWQLIAGKIAPYLLVNAVQAVLMLAVGIYLMPLIGGEGMSLQGVDWTAMLLIVFSISLAAICLALAVACLVNTHAQAATLGPILNVLMAALGGVMVPLFVMPEVMQKVAAYSPMNWGLEGLLAVLLRGGEVSDVLPEAAKLLGFALLMLMIAFVLFKRRAW